MQETGFGLKMENERQHEIKFTFLLTPAPHTHPAKKGPGGQHVHREGCR